MRTIEARAILSAADKTGSVFDRIAAKIGRITSAAAAASRSTAAAARTVSTAERSSGIAARAQRSVVAASARVLGPAAAVYGGAQAVKRFGETDLAVTRIGITADATDAQIEDLQTRLRDLAYEGGKGFNEVREGIESLVTGGMDLKKAGDALPAIIKTAQAAGAEVKDIATTTLSLDQAMGIATNKMQSAFDVMVTGGKAGKFELKDMARYFPSIAPAAAAIGLKGEKGLKKIVAVMQTIRQGTGTTEEAAASIQNIFAKMESEETTNKFEKFGIDLRKEMAKTRKEGGDLLATFTQLTEKATKGDLSKIPQLFTDMEFARGMRALLTYKDTLRDVSAELEKAGGSTMRDFDRVVARPQIAINRLSESFDRLKTSAGAAFEAMGASSVMNWLSKNFEQSAEYWNKSKEERLQIEIENDRRGRLEKRMREVGSDIDFRENKLREGDKLGWWKRRADGDKRSTDEMVAGDEQLQELRTEMFELRSALERPGHTASQLFSDAEVKKLQDAVRDRRLADDPNSLTPQFDTPFRKKGSIPTPDADPRKRSGGGPAFPAASDLDLSGITAKLEGSAEVKGEAMVKVEVTAGSDLIALKNSVESALARLEGKLMANGAGSTGRSSPDAAPSSGIGSR
jgi:TP901 family phage tail tape measure protein